MAKSTVDRRSLLRHLSSLITSPILLAGLPVAVGAQQAQPDRVQLARMRDNAQLTPKDVALLPPAMAEHLNLRPGWEARNVTGFSVAVGGEILFATNVHTVGFAARAAIVFPYGNWRWTPLWLPSLTSTSLVARDSVGHLSWNKEARALEVSFCDDVLSERNPFQCVRSSYHVRWGEARLLRIDASGDPLQKEWKRVWEKGKWVLGVE